jgi:hypothetical protein
MITGKLRLLKYMIKSLDDSIEGVHYAIERLGPQGEMLVHDKYIHPAANIQELVTRRQELRDEVAQLQLRKCTIISEKVKTKME